MPSYKLDLSWDGTNYCGWQFQPNALSIQEVVEKALSKIFPNEQIALIGAGRTDAGVHAIQQIAAFHIQHERHPQIILRGLNSKLPKDIVCTKVEQVPDGFHPRHHSKEKLYRYRILTREVACPFRHQTTWHIGRPLNLNQMQIAAQLFVGDHDFASFRAQGCTAKSTFRTIIRSELLLHQDELHFEVQGKGFLRHMVRIMTGSLVAVGLGKIDQSDIERALQTPDRSILGQTAPSHGLWLVWTSLLDNQERTE